MRSLLVLVAIVAVPAIGRADEAPIPKCQGNDKATAQHSRALGLQHYRASKREGTGDPEMTTALGFFDAACVGGDDTALELRAYALAALERYVEAAKSLDAFLLAHPMDSLPDDVKARLESQRPEILRHVASLGVTSMPEGARVSVNHRAVGVTPIKNLWLAPGTYDLVIETDSGTQKRTADLAAGPHDESFDFTPKIDHTPPPAPPPASPPSEKPRRSLTPFIITGGALTAVGAAIGIAGAVWQSSSSDAYNATMCSRTGRPAACDAITNDILTARGLETAGFIAGGVFAVTTGILLVLELTKKVPETAMLPCAPGLGGTMCTVRF